MLLGGFHNTISWGDLLAPTFATLKDDLRHAVLYLLQVILDGLLFCFTLAVHFGVTWFTGLFHVTDSMLALWVTACEWAFIVSSYLVVLIKIARDLREVTRRYFP